MPVESAERVQAAMKEDITERVEQCRVCHGYFVLGLEGEGRVCDKCRDMEESHVAMGEWDRGELAL